MARPLKVFGWYGRREGTTHGDSREIIAASSKAEVCRLLDKRPSQLRSIAPTRDPVEIAVAMAKPGVVHWRDHDTLLGGWKT